jgi:nitronate monooxygenase
VAGLSDASERLLARLRVRLPLVQAPMAGVQGHALAAAVARAGALGSLPGAMLTPAALQAEVVAFRAVAGGVAPLNLNFFCHAPPQPDPARAAAWAAVLRAEAVALGLQPAEVPPGPVREPFGEAMTEAVEALRPAVVSFHFGLPVPARLARVKACGAAVLATATTVDEARWLVAAGVDAVIAQGLEAGGHRGHFLAPDPASPAALADQAPLAELLPAVAAAVRVPVVAAGGIATAADVAAAMAAGAAAVQVGSAFLRCPEAATPALHRAALAGEAARHTAVTNLFTGRPARGLVNRLITDLGALRSEVPAFPSAAAALAPLRAAAEALGRTDVSPLWAGTGAWQAEERPAGEVVLSLSEGFEDRYTGVRCGR